MLTDDWKSDSFRADVARWARAAAAVTRWKSLKVAIFGYAMNDMGDIRVDESALIRSLGPEILAVAPGDMYRGMLDVTDAQVDEVIAFEDANFEIDPRLSAEEREDHARMQVAIEQILDRPRVRRLHRALRRDRRGRPVQPAAAGRRLHR